MNIAIVDDMQSEIDILKGILTEYAAIKHISLDIDEYGSGEDFLKSFSPFAYTIIFMDIYMNGITGTKTAETIRKSDADTIIIYLTTSNEHMAEAFSTHAYDYIEKPAVRERLFRVMDDVLRSRTPVSDNRLTFSVSGQDHILPYADIVSVCTADHNYLNIDDRHNNTYRPRMTFSAVMDILSDDSRFLQINRNILVNMDCISSFDDNVCRLNNGSSFPVYTKKVRDIEQKWNNYMFIKLRKSGKGGFRL